MKICSTCQQEKPLSEFHKARGYRDGHTGQCKPCRSIAIKKWRKENPDKVRAINKRYYATDKGKALWKRERIKHAERRKATLERWKTQHPEALARYSIEKTVKRRGMTVEEYQKFVADHNHRCDICGTAKVGKIRLAVDHCHSSEKNRGLLCVNCNSLLGMAKDSVEILRKAIDYLERWELQTKSAR